MTKMLLQIHKVFGSILSTVLKDQVVFINVVNGMDKTVAKSF